MSAPWRLAFRCGLWTMVLAAPVAALIWYLFSGVHAGAFSYGVGIGLVSFISTALTVTLLTGGGAAWVVAGVGSFVARYGFVVAALGVPAYLGLWPVVAMLGGFAAVHLAENVVLVPVALKMAGDLGVSSEAGSPVRVGQAAERKVKI